MFRNFNYSNYNTELENKIMVGNEKIILKIGQHTKLWFLLHPRVAKAPTSLHVRMTSPGLSVLA